MKGQGAYHPLIEKLNSIVMSSFLGHITSNINRAGEQNEITTKYLVYKGLSQVS